MKQLSLRMRVEFLERRELRLHWPVRYRCNECGYEWVQYHRKRDHPKHWLIPRPRCIWCN